MTEVERSEREAEFLELARALFRRMFKPEDQPRLGTSTEREDRACEAGDALSRALRETHLRGVPPGGSPPATVGAEGYSAAVLREIEFAGANAGSFQEGAASLRVLAHVDISAKHVQRLTVRLGTARRAERDRQVDASCRRERSPPP